MGFKTVFHSTVRFQEFQKIIVFLLVGSVQRPPHRGVRFVQSVLGTNNYKVMEHYFQWSEISLIHCFDIFSLVISFHKFDKQTSS
jgi:hypothetical protein